MWYLHLAHWKFNLNWKSLLDQVVPIIKSKPLVLISSFSEHRRVRRFKVPNIARNWFDWYTLLIVGHLERWRLIIRRWWFPFHFSDCALMASRELHECVMHSLIICIGTVWSEWWIILMHVWLWRFNGLGWQFFISYWTYNITRIVKSTKIVPLATFLLSSQWVEGLLLQFRLMISQFFAQDLLLDIIVRFYVFITIFQWIIKGRSSLSSLSMNNTNFHRIC